MSNRPTKEKALINAGSELMGLYTTLNSLKEDRDKKREQLDVINTKIKATVAAIKKKGGIATTT